MGYACSDCGKAFARRYNLMRHVNLAHDSDEPISRSGGSRTQYHNPEAVEDTNSMDSNSVFDTDSDEEDHTYSNDSELTPGEITSVRHAIAWAEIGEHELTKRRLRSMVKDFPEDADDASDVSDDDEEEASDQETDQDESKPLGPLVLSYLREMFKAIEEYAYHPSRHMFFDMVDSLNVED
jgi:Zinc finger, C2H2 type